MNNSKEVSSNWKIVEVKNISLKVQYGYTTSSVSKDTGIRLLRITDIQNYKVDWDTVPFCNINPNDVDRFLLEENDLVFARTGATVGKSFLINGTLPKSIFASYLIRIQLSKNINPKYLFYFFQSADYWKQVGIKSMGIGQPNVNATSLSNIQVPVCSLNEQNHIVDRIETLLGDLEESQTALKKTLKFIAGYEFLILKSAFDGNLTKDWRKYNKDQSAYSFLEELSQNRLLEYERAVQTNNLAQAKRIKFDFKFEKHQQINSWAISKLDRLITISARVGWKGLKKEEYTSEGPLFLSVHSLNRGKSVDFEDTNHISYQRYEESPDIMLQTDDVLLCKDGAGIGKVAIVNICPINQQSILR